MLDMKGLKGPRRFKESAVDQHKLRGNQEGLPRNRKGWGLKRRKKAHTREFRSDNHAFFFSSLLIVKYVVIV